MSGKGRSQMMQGWYHHSMAQQSQDLQDDDDEEDEEEYEVGSQSETIDYKEQYKRLKRKLKYLIYENECYQENLRNSRAKLLEIARDRSFLLDRLLQYEKVDVSSSSESGEDTESSDGEIEAPRQDMKRRKLETSSHHALLGSHTPSTSSAPKIPATKKKKPTMRGSKQNASNMSHGSLTIPSVAPAASSLAPDGHMTPEEVERHLSARGHSFMGLLPEKAPPTVPTEMFSNEPSLDSESNDLGDFETSPSNLGDDCLSVDMLGD